MYKHLLIFCSILWCLILPLSGQAQSLADENVFVSTLQKEVQHQYQQYRNREVPICSLAVHVETTDDYFLESSMGSLTRNQHLNQRTLTVDLLVGDLQKGNVTKGTSAGKCIRVPLDYNTQAIVHTLGQTIKTVYADAEKRFLTRKDAERINKKDFDPIPFTEREVLITDIQAPKNSDISIDVCTNLLNESTELWNTLGTNTRGGAAMHYTHVRSYDFHNNGTALIAEQHVTTLTLSATLQDKSGTIIPLEKTFMAEYPADLPDKNSLWQEETALYEQLQLLADAPAAEAATCPVLLSNQAAALTLYATHLAYPQVSHDLLSIKEDPGFFAVTPTSSNKETELLQQLKQTIKSQNKPFGYWIQSVRCSENEGLVPQILYRVYPDTRANERVRGTLSIKISPMVWSLISACDHTSDCATAIHPNAQPTECCAPAILCHQLELRNLNPISQPNLLSPIQPDQSQADITFSTMATQIAQDEIRYFFEDTNLFNTPKPYDIEYLITDGRSLAIQSSMGSLLSVSEEPLRSINTRLLLGNDNLNNENLSVTQESCNSSLPLDHNYANMAQAVHQATNDAYRQALLDYSAKMRILDNLPAEQQKSRLSDRSESKRESYFLEDIPEKASLARLQTLANELSAKFAANADILSNSGVNLYVFQSTAYFISAQNIQYAQPFDLFYIEWFAETIAENGDTIKDCSYRIFRKIDEITDLNSEITAMTNRLLAFKKADKMVDSYDGPVLFSEEAAAALLTRTLLDGTPSLVATPAPADPTGRAYNYWENMKNKTIVSPILRVSAHYDTDRYGDTPLIGFYRIDAEGVPVMKETGLIRHGVLEDMLSSRSPSPIGKYSNGHCRLALCNGQLQTCTGAGIVEVSGARAMDEDAMLKELLKQAKAAGHKYAYQIVKLGQRKAQNGTSVLYPLFTYRIKVSNGDKKPIRIQNGGQIDARILNHIKAVSSDKNVFNILTTPQNRQQETTESPINGIPTSLIAPSHLLVNLFFLLPEN